MKKGIILFALVLLFHMSNGQEKYFFVALDIQKPLSNTSWISEVSSRGIKVGYRYFINDRFSAGVEFSSNAFDQYHPTQTVENATGAITTDYFKYIYSYSGVISGQYYFKAGDNEKFFPYAGIGLGANNNEYVTYYNIYQDNEIKWGFLARPEAGILYKFSGRRSFAIMAAVHYDYSTNKSDMFGYNNFSALGFQIGVAFMED